MPKMTLFSFCYRAELQIESTLDYATDSWFCNVFTGKWRQREVVNHYTIYNGSQNDTVHLTSVFRSFPGALNHQTAHHLFPGVAQIYYPQITPIVVQACKEFGVRYNYKDTMFEALGAHFSHLKTLGQEEDKPVITRPEVWMG